MVGLASGAGAVGVAEPSWIDAKVGEIVSVGRGVVKREELGRSLGGRPIHLLTIARGAEGEVRPAVLIVAGIDARHRVGVETALGVAEAWASSPPEWLVGRTVYVVPCLNPDGFVRGGPRADTPRRDEPGDADRDGRTDEDPAEDLNGDGLITMMRVADPGPALRLTPTMVDDPDFPGLMRAPDAAAGERATYAVLIEGLDNDGDGSFNEDGWGGSGGGGIDLDSNFPAHWPEFSDGAGVRPLQAPETLALARWALDRGDIAAVIVYGRHDTVTAIPKAGEMDASRQVPLGIEQDDKALYEAASKRFKEITGIHGAPRPDTNGSFVAWAYAHLGVPAFSTPVWVRPDQVAEDKRPKPAEKPGATREEGDAAPTPRPEPKTDEAKWLRYFEGRSDLPGFVPWRAFDHPQLGPVEIGGFIPGAMMNPPPEEVSSLVDRQSAFVADLAGRLPMIEVEGVGESLAGGLWRVTMRARNAGEWPTLSAIGRKARRNAPTRITIDAPVDRLVSGEKTRIEWSIPGGGHAEARWTLRTEGMGKAVVRVTSPILGTRTVEIPLEDAR